MKKSSVLLFIIVLIASVLRFWDLGRNPASLDWDEAAWGYNAYALGIDGKDEFGQVLPYKYLESFGDYKPPVYTYLAILPIKLFGLNEFATRFPSAFFGSLTVFLCYFLVKRIYSGSTNRIFYALCASLFLAVSPWHINLSRAAFEANIASFFLVLGTLLFFIGIQEKKWFLIFSVISFVLAIYTFNTSRIVAPLLLAGLVVGSRKNLLPIKKETIIAVVIGCVFILPLIGFLKSPQASLRFKEVNIFSDISVIQRINQEVAYDNSSFWSRIIHNRRLTFGVEYIKHYFDNLNPAFLFIYGDENGRFSTRDVGLFYIWEIPMVVLGFLYLFKNREGKWWIIPYWLFIGIIPAATARETPHALRIETTIPTFQIITAIGLVTFLNCITKMFSKRIIQASLLFITSMLLIFNVYIYLRGYYVHYARESAMSWNYGYKDSIAFVTSVANQYDQINVTRKLGRPYIYYLFYTKTSPDFFRKNAIVERDVFGLVDVKGFGKYRFADDLHSITNPSSKVLYINMVKEVPSTAKVIKEFRLPDGRVQLVAYIM